MVELLANHESQRSLQHARVEIPLVQVDCSRQEICHESENCRLVRGNY